MNLDDMCLITNQEQGCNFPRIFVFLFFLILLVLIVPAYVQAQVPEQVDPFYKKLFEDGKYFYQSGDYAGAASNFGVAFFGFVGNPPQLLECYIYLEVCFAQLKNAEKAKYYYDEIKRLRLQSHLKNLKLPEDLEVKYLEVNAAFARLEAKAGGGSGVVASKTEPKLKSKPESQPLASSPQKEDDSKPRQTAPPPSTSKKEAVSPPDALATEIKQLEDSIKKDKGNPDPYFRLSMLFVDQKKFKDARAALESLLGINPKNGLAYLELGKIYIAEQKTKEALAAFEKAAALLPDNPAPHYALGKLYFDLKNYDKAKQSFSLAQRIDSNYKDVARYMASLGDIGTLRITDSQVYLQKARSERDAYKKIGLYIDALKADPYNVDIYFEIKDAYLNEKQYKEAAKVLEPLLKNYPNDIRIYRGLGDIYIKDKAFGKAVTILEPGIKIDGKDVELHYLLGKACMGLKRYNEAAAEFDIVLTSSAFYKDTRDLRKSCLDKIKK
jgi:tetratricopeptide (TPR) repeat protein